MRRGVRKIGISARSLLSVFLLLAAFLEAGNSQAVDSNFATFALQERQFTLREPILLDFEVVNPTSDDLHLDLGDDRKGNFQISITEPHGKTVVVGKKPPQNGITFLGKIRVEPGETYSQTLVLNEWYTFREVGRYRISVVLTAPMKSGRTSRRVHPLAFEIDFTQRNPDQLAGACRSLVTRVQQARSVGPAMEAAHALSYVDDPVAVPFLEEILTDWRVVGHAIAGLQRIRSPEAIAVLIRALKITEHETALRARVALGLIAHETDDEATRSMITAVLKE